MSNQNKNKMASIKFGNIVVDMRGKISGNVYSKNKGGAYSRVRVIPTNPKSAAQATVRGFLTQLSQAWRGLGAAAIHGWNQAVVNFQKKNRLADMHVINGNALYVSLNKNLLDVGLAAIDTPPSVVEVSPLVVSSAVADQSANTLIITLDAVVPALTSVKVFASPAVSPGVNSIGSKLRQIGSAGSGDAAALDMTAEYNAVFGVVGSVGSKIFYKLIPVSEVNGQAGGAIEGQIVIVA